jgi:hypothetical protein
MFVRLLFGNEVLAVLEAFDLELMAFSPGVDVLHVVCKNY